MKRTLTQAIREVLANWGQGEINLDELADRLGVQSWQDRKRVRSALAEMVKRGEVEKVGMNLYRPANKAAGQPTKQEVMWRVLRARRTVTVADVVELAGVSRDYAQEFLRHLAKRQVVSRQGDTYRLLSGQAELPRNETKAAYLRRYREARQRALAALDAVFAAVAEARMAIADLPEREVGDGE